VLSLTVSLLSRKHRVFVSRRFPTMTLIFAKGAGGQRARGAKGRGGPDGTVPANELCGFCPRSWAWADAELLAMGFDGPDPVPMP